MIPFIQHYPFILAFLLGLIPALVWLWFWLKEDEHPEPAKMITLSFLGGILAVLLVLPIQQFLYPYIKNSDVLAFSVYATMEELFKFGIVYFIALRNKALDDEPVDNIIYLITSALGFVAFENTLFLINPIANGNIADSIINGNLRFIGAGLLHVISSATIGIFMAFSFYKSSAVKKISLFSGIILAIILHISFNLSIIRGAQDEIFFIFAGVWACIVILMLLFEKVKHINS